MKYFVTGASGHLGQRVVKQLQQVVENGDTIFAGVHNMAKDKLFDGQSVQVSHLDYFDEGTIDQSFQNTDVLIYIPSITYNLVRRVQEFENVLAVAKRNQVGSFIFVSFFADQVNNPFQMSPFYAYVPRRLAGSGLKYAYVRNSLYADPLPPYLPELIERGHLIYPVGDQPLTFISRDDSAKAIAALATQPTMRDHGQSYLLSMTRNYNMVELGKLMTEITGHHIGYQPVTVEEFGKIYPNEGGAELASMYAAGGRGLLAEVSDDYHRLTGEDPTGMTEYLKDHYQAK
ncbi:MAG TPA: NAD(P)H-binding protein [Candidatus Limosilactobacillus merdipullorum]|uniref:NAD(P)H-binding protein n=1 Tax=Candidatus Limosilactobacillus merdipullorum TaxID=2838653 RepID=A0A9D1QS04_9LACO|nr:NAD(P)H-binding protein [Candidatus Limosilactobacillus merdipullorum]